MESFLVFFPCSIVFHKAEIEYKYIAGVFSSSKIKNILYVFLCCAEKKKIGKIFKKTQKRKKTSRREALDHLSLMQHFSD